MCPFYANYESALKDYAILYGIVRYYSPNPYTLDWSETDWYKVCAYCVSKLDSVPLKDILYPISPDIRISDGPIDIQSHQEQNEFYFRENHGGGKIPIRFPGKVFMSLNKDAREFYSNLFFSKLRKWEIQESDVMPEPLKYYSYNLPSGKKCNVIHCNVKSAFDEKQAKNILNEAISYWDCMGGNTGQKLVDRVKSRLQNKNVILADIIVRWNIVRHLYPYYEDDRLDWDNRLSCYLTKALALPEKITPSQFYNFSREFMGVVEDGHLKIYGNISLNNHIGSYLKRYYARGCTLAINDTILISASDINGGKVAILDSVNHMDAFSYLKNYKKNVSAATDKSRSLYSSYEFINSETPDTLDVSWRGNCHSSQVSSILPVDATSVTYFTGWNRVEKSREIASGIYCFNTAASDFSYSYVRNIIKQGYKKFIFDLRCYPSYKFDEIIKHLIEKDVPYLPIYVPITRYPFHNQIEYEVIRDTIRAKLPTLRGDIVFLCDERSQSWAETILTLVKSYNLGTIIGDYTAGTNGDISSFNLPLFNFMMTGVKVCNPDGSKHHGLGVEPDIIVSNCASDILNNRDTPLERAIAFLNER